LRDRDLLSLLLRFHRREVLALDDSRPVPSQTMYDGHNYYPTNKWVLFGHHFAAISGAGPLIGPVLAAQFGFLPGLLWLVIGVCLGGAVHDFMISPAAFAAKESRSPKWRARRLVRCQDSSPALRFFSSW
jgi:carbon starvation protein CstA